MGFEFWVGVLDIYNLLLFGGSFENFFEDFLNFLKIFFNFKACSKLFGDLISFF